MTDIVIIDDHVMLGQVLEHALTQRSYAVQVLDLDSDIIAQVEAATPRIVLLDLELGDDRPLGRDLIEDLATIAEHVIVLSGVTEPLLLAECLENGAAGVLSKGSEFDRLVEAIVGCDAGEPIPPTAAERVALSTQLAASRRAQRATGEPFATLSEREGQVLALLCQGQSAAEISETSYVSISTVRSQIKAVLRKLGVSSQLQAVAMANAAEWRPPHG